MEKKRLGDICTVVSGTTPKTGNEEYWNGDHLWITPAELSDDSFIVEDTVRKITDKAIKDKSLKPFPKGTVLLSSRAPIGKVAIAGQEMYCNQGFKNLICKKEIQSEYLYWFLKGKNAYLNSLGRGATFKEISKTIVEDIKIPLPHLKQQEHISVVLNKCKEIIALKNKQLEELDILIKSRFVEVFGDSRTNSMGYPTSKLQELGRVGSSKRVFVDELVEEGIPFFRGTEIGSLAEGKSITPELFITEEHFKRMKEATGVPQLGDLLMPSICPDGRIWRVDNEDSFYFKDGRVLWVNVQSDRVNSIYLLYALKDKFLNDYSNIASGTTFAELKIFALKDADILMPDIELQNQFATFIEHVDKLKFELQKSLDETRVLFDSLMQEYFE